MDPRLTWVCNIVVNMESSWKLSCSRKPQRPMNWSKTNYDTKCYGYKSSSIAIKVGESIGKNKNYFIPGTSSSLQSILNTDLLCYKTTECRCLAHLRFLFTKTVWNPTRLNLVHKVLWNKSLESSYTV